MATPKLKVGDTFVFTKEMWKAADKTFPKFNIGQMMEVTRVYENWYQLCGLYYPLFDWIDPFLPETNPRTLDDVKEGDVLVDRSDNRYLVLGRSGRIVALSDSEIEVDDGEWEWMTMAELKNLGYKFADQPEERWKPKEGDKYYYIDVDGEVYFSTFDSGVGFKLRTIEIGNSFETAEEAEKAASELKEFWRGRINNQK